MKLLVYVILAQAVLVVGCTSPAPTSPSGPTIKGIKIQDIASPQNVASEPVIAFLVTVFHIEPLQLPQVWTCCEMLPQNAIRYSDPRAFEANGFAAAMGSGRQLSALLGCLKQTGAVQFGQTNLLANPDAETPFIEIPIGRKLDILDGADPVSLRNGTLSWSVNGHLDAPSLRRAAAVIEPIFIPQMLSNWPGAERYAEKVTHRFPSGRMEAAFKEGDFIVLTARHSDETQMSDLERLFFYHSGNRPRIRLYVIVFVGVEQ